MPNYDYKCLQCGYLFELYQRMTEEPIKICPKCNGHVKRLIGAGTGPIFKGSGFYQTDYKNKSVKKNISAAGEKSSSIKKD
jgi:putative FmdB family regulatory protein